nr:unnamed protein product [Leishmania braziliensis]
MWGNDFYKAGAHQQPSLRHDGLPTSFASPSYTAQPARPLPAGVLSADLARPISVRELAHSRVPAVPPPPAVPPAPRRNPAMTGFAGFGIPTSPIIYAATSGVSTLPPLSTRADASDLMSLAHRDIDNLSGDDLYNYASHLQGASKQYSKHLLEAYTRRDQYRGEVARLKEELHSKYLQIDVLRREQERASEALVKVREDNAQLHQKLAESEGHVRNMQAKVSVLSGADPSAAVHFYQSQLVLKDAQLRELQQQCEREAAASSQRHSSSATAAEHGRRSINVSGEGAAVPQISPLRDLPSTRKVHNGSEAASTALHTTLEELQHLNTSLSRRLEEEHAAHKAALAVHAEENATATADRAELLNTISQLRQQCTEMQSTEDELVAALTQRAPISKEGYAALQTSYNDLTAALAKAEDQIAALHVKEQQYHQSAQQAQEELRHSLTTGLEERQELQARNEQMQSLATDLQRELELAERANQLRQEQLDAAVSGNQQLAEHLRTTQEQLLGATAELQDLCNTRGSLESQLRELRQRIEEFEQEDQRRRQQHRDVEGGATFSYTPAASAESETVKTREALEDELATLRSQRDALVGDRDEIISEVRRLQEDRLALLRSPLPQAEEVLQKHLSTVKATLGTHADDEELPQQEDIAALEAARHCIEQLKETIATLQSERVRVEAELQAKIKALEAELASQSRALSDAEDAAAAQRAHLEGIMVALRDELVATQEQQMQFITSEEAQRERCAEQQRAVEHLQAQVAQLQMAGQDSANSLATTWHAQSPVPAKSDLSTMNAALESLAHQLEDAQYRAEELSAEHARTLEELARATRAAAELEARAAEAESRREAAHAAAEGTEVELTARIAALATENAQLKEKLSASRAAVTTFASKQTDGESTAASLEERCATEARRREAAEAEALVLRETLDRTGAELTEVLQRSEGVQSTLTRTVDRLAEQEALVGVLGAENMRLQDELTAVRESILLLTSERDALVEETAQLHGKLAAAESRMSDAAAAQQRLEVRLEEAEAAVRSKAVELDTVFAALDQTASEVCGAEQQLRVYAEAKEELSAEHARTLEELARATRAAAELEARAAEAESRREAAHAAAEGTEVELTARIAALATENAQLKEKLSASRAAVTTFASKQTDGESTAASLEERCATEARRREAAEAEALVLRETLDRTGAELTEVLQRSEGVQSTLTRAVDRLAEQEALVGVLGAENMRLQDELTAVRESILLLTSERDALVEETAQLHGKLAAAESRMSDAAAAQQRLEVRLEEAEAAVRSKAVELDTVFAALDQTASEVCGAEQQLRVYAEAKEELSAEHARTLEELARATRAAAELEARAAEAESRREAAHAAAEGTEVELTARIAALATENAQLKEKLSASRAAVTTFASKQTDGESTAASLEERCATEARRREAAEAEALVLRETLDRTGAELTEVLQRSEGVQSTLTRAVDRLAEQEALVGVLGAENMRLQDELTAVRESILLLTSERDALVEETAQLHGKLAAAESRMSDAAAAQQRLEVRLEEAEAAVRSKAVELDTVFAALDQTASEVCGAEQQLRVYAEAKEELSAEHARTLEELARATRAAAELEARAAEAESRREAAHAAAEGTEVELTARIAALATENAQLKEKLSASRAAVTTFASKQTDGESTAASLEERCATEARRREAAEAEALVLRETLDRTGAELTEVLQRSEGVQSTLTRTVDRLAEQEALLEQLNRNASELNDARAVLTGEVTRLQAALAAAVTDKSDVMAQLVATQRELDRAVEQQDAQYCEEVRLQDALTTTMSAFGVQTRQVQLGMAHVVDMSRAFYRVVEVVAKGAASATVQGEIVDKEAAAQSFASVGVGSSVKGASPTATSVREILLPWSRALEWVASMEERLESLGTGSTSSDTTSSDSQCERRRRRRGRSTVAVEEEEAMDEEETSGADAVSTSFLCRAVPASHAEAAFARWIWEQAAAASTIADLRSALADKEVELNNLRSAMDTLANDVMAEQDRADNLSAAIGDATKKIALVQAEFEEQLRQRTVATTAEVVEARRAEERARAAQLRAEEHLTVVENELKEQQAVLRKLQDENHRLTREADRLRRSSRHLESDSRALNKISDSVTPQPLSYAGVSAVTEVESFTTAASAVEVVEQAQFLQVFSLQEDLMLSRRQARELEGREATLRQTCATLEQQVSQLRVEATDAEKLREELATLRTDYAELEERYDQLERMTTAAGGGTMQELKQLRQQLKARETELDELKARVRGLVLNKVAPELEAARRQEALRESLSGITTQLAATQAQYGGGTGGSSNAGSRRASLASALSKPDHLSLSASSPSSQDLLTSRIEHLQILVHDHQEAFEKVQAAQLESRATMDTLEDQLAAKTAALERAEGLVAEYADTINVLTMTAVVGRGSGGAHLSTVQPLRNEVANLVAEVPSLSVLPLTPLTPRPDVAADGQPRAAVAVASPTPRMPNLDEVAANNDGSVTDVEGDSAGSSADTALPSATHRRTDAEGSRRSARGTPARRSSSSSSSNNTARKSFVGVTMIAKARKRARSSTTA